MRQPLTPDLLRKVRRIQSQLCGPSSDPLTQVEGNRIDSRVKRGLFTTELGVDEASCDPDELAMLIARSETSFRAEGSVDLNQVWATCRANKYL